ncbi:uncharacterized protein LOC129571611 [Sitodiplosis mosellana]|uniref:uncharacterized protein LOC129571611 n=1 Tax=Sitodiplosis mosellana TaxID=263140 RepID=UPI0024452459|nr:uncharacterized protein LOC129571611 [Sitodiplosis mosellana]XP_055307403.1 uncharacterized protein LOC129571611 [Sitodiplosis mosellana]XP_055307404.1 uncharacterized protein LOC129571611 [Sitodiplosis mosellana]
MFRLTNVNQNVLNAFNELNIKEEILIKEDTDVLEVVEKFNLAGEYLEIIHLHDLAVLDSMAKLAAAADAMGQPNGILPTNAQAMVRASKSFVKNMKQILYHAQVYEVNTHIVPDYDLQDETNICSLGWYARMIRQTLTQRAQIAAAIKLYCGSGNGSVSALATQLDPGYKLLSALRTHARARYPNYNNYVIV